MDYYLNRFKSKVSSVAAQVTQVLPGNPVFREYEVHEQVASAGPGLSWKIFSGTKNSTKQPVSIWLFEKRQVDKWPKPEKDTFPELLKRGVAQLTRLRHPRLLVVERAIEESRDTFAFCTEPVLASLANIFSQRDCTVQSHLQDFTFLDVEIQHGLFQLSEALVFLHNDAKILHGNICPTSIIINEKGAWKLAGFDFCILGSLSSSGQTTYEVNEWDRRLMANMNPELNYAAPELVQGVKCDVYADVFSFGILACTLFNNNKPLFESKNMLDEYTKNLAKIKQISIDSLHQIPKVLKEDIKVCLNFTPELRPDAIQLTKISYFDDALLKIFNCLDSLMQMDNSQKMQFFKGLTLVLNKFPKRPLLQKIFPYLAGEFVNVDLVPFILPNVFLIAEEANNQEFSSVIFPSLIPVFGIQRPYQTVLLLLQKIPLFLEKTPDVEVKKHILPLVYNSLLNENSKIQELCLLIIPSIGKLVDRDAMKTQLIPKLLRLVLEGNNLSIRVQTLICLGKLMPHLEPWMVSDQILTALPKISSKEPGILMAILGIYKLAFETKMFGISTDQCARSVLPFLVSSCVENSLNVQQFDQYWHLITTMLQKIEKEHRQRLYQLSASQEEQRSINLNEILNSTSSQDILQTKVNTRPSDLAGAGIFRDSATNQNANNGNEAFPFGMVDFFSTASSTSTLNLGKGLLSLEEKKRLAAEQEQSLQPRANPKKISKIDNVENSSAKNVDLFSPDYKPMVPSPVATAPANNDLNFFASWGVEDNNVKKNDTLFANFPQPPSCAGNLVQRAGVSNALTSKSLLKLDELFGSLNQNSSENNTLEGIHTAPLSAQSFQSQGINLNELSLLSNVGATNIGNQLQSSTNDQKNRSVLNHQSDFSAFANAPLTGTSSFKNPFDLLS